MVGGHKYARRPFRAPARPAPFVLSFAGLCFGFSLNAPLAEIPGRGRTGIPADPSELVRAGNHSANGNITWGWADVASL